MKTVSLLSLALILSACTPAEFRSLEIEAHTTVDIAPTSACPNGGVQVRVYVDSNRNNQLDPGEDVKSTNLVCNGTNGSNGNDGHDGISTGLDVSSATKDQCSNGGFVITAFQDIDNDGLLGDSDVILSSTVVCNGTNGSDGQNGHNGKDGKDGSDGHNGNDGQNGKDGKDGSSKHSGKHGKGKSKGKDS